MGFFSHTDTVPGQEQDWDAYHGVVEGDKLYGRGSCDMKGPLACTMVAAGSVDAAELKRIINDNSVTGLVHGHLHENLSYRVGTTPCYCTASASSTYAPALASYRLLEFTGSNLMTNRLFQADGQTSPQFVECKAS